MYILSGQRWKQMRPVLSPTFTASKMKVMFQLMNEVADTFINYHKNMKRNGIIEVEMKESHPIWK